MSVGKICIELSIKENDLIKYINNESVKISHEINRDINKIERIFITLNNELESNYGSESEKEWHKKLLDFMDYLDEIKRRNIEILSSKFEI